MARPQHNSLGAPMSIKPSPSMIVAMLALIVALGGAAFAAANSGAMTCGAAPSMPSAGMNMSTTPDPAAARRRALQKSSLDYIVEQSTALKTRLGTSDVARMDLFLTSVRNLENRVLNVSATVTQGCRVGTRPAQAPAVQFARPGADRFRGVEAVAAQVAQHAVEVVA